MSPPREAPRLLRTPLLFCLLLCAGLLKASVGWAQNAGDREFHRQRQERLLEEQKQKLDELRRRPAVEPSERARAPGGQSCFPIQRIEITGASLLKAAARAALLAPYQNRCLHADDIEALLRELTERYLARGYVTARAYLPEQELSTGILRIVLVEGQLESLQAAPGSGVRPRELFMAFPGRIGRPLQLREIEQLLDQLNRLPAKRASIELEPGQRAGASRALVSSAAEKPWRLHLGRHNDGERSTGKQRLEAGLEWDSPLGLADQILLRAGRSLSGGARNGSLHYSLPWGWWTAIYDFHYSDYESGFRNGDFLLETEGRSRSHKLRAARVAHRDASSKTTVSLALERTESRHDIEGIRLDLSSVRLTEAGLGLSHGRRLGAAYLNLDLGWQRGLPLLGAERDRRLPKEAAHAQYDKYTATGSLLIPFALLSQNLSWESVAFWQKSEDILHSPRQVGLSGQSAVRGFKEQSLYGSTGGYWRTQLGWTRAVPWPWLQAVCQDVGIALAWDVGAIERDEANRHTGQYGRLSGHALELSANGRHARARLTLARSEKRPSAFQKHETPFWFRLDLSY